MHAIRIDEILLRRGSSGLVRVIAPAMPSHQETALGRPFGFLYVNVPHTPQIDSLAEEIDAAVEHAYAHGSLRPGQTPEQFFEETVAKVRQTVAASLARERINIDPSLMTIALGCVAGSDLFLTRHGRAEAYLLRRQSGAPTKTLDVFRGFSEGSGDRLLSDLVVGAIGENDLLLLATDSLFAVSPVADIIEATDRSEAAAVAARIRSIILAAPGGEPVAGCLLRTSPIRAMFRAKENASVSTLRTREEEVARTLSPSGLPGVGAFLDRFKPKEKPANARPLEPRPAKALGVKPTRPLGPKKPLIDRFNSLPVAAKRAAVVLLALLAIFLVSLKLISANNARLAQDKQFASAVAAVNKQIDMAESTLIYDEGRAQAVLAIAQGLAEALPNRTAAENSARQSLDARLNATDRKLKHLYDVKTSTWETLNGPASIAVRLKNGWLTSGGADLLLLDDRGSPTTIATLPEAPVWAAPLNDADGNILLWLKNGTLVSVGTSGKSLPRALDYSGPADPRAGATWNGNLYVLTSDGTQIWKLPPTMTGFGRGSAYLTTPLTGKGASAIAINGQVLTPIAGDAIRRFSKGKMDAFAAGGATANSDPAGLVLGATDIYLLGNDNTIAVWDQSGKLLAQYALPADTGKTAAFAVDETAKTVVVVTDKGVVEKFDLAK